MGSMSQKPHRVEDLWCGLFFGTPTAKRFLPDLLRRLAQSFDFQSRRVRLTVIRKKDL
jgi:hypothetical protein